MMKSIFTLLLAMSLCACSGLDRFVEYETPAPKSFPILTATGMAPLSAQQGDNEQEKMRRAMRASKLDAYRELAEQVYGQRVQGQSQIDGSVLGDDGFRTSVDGVIRGARVVRSYPVGDSYITELELDYGLVWELYQQQPVRRVKSVRYY